MGARSFTSLLAAVLVLGSPARAETTPAIKVDGGRVSGLAQNGVETFKGIPFAAPPVGDLRWRAPQPVKRWTGVKAAERFGPACMQAAGPAMRAEEMSEDCLTVNVWRPAGLSRDAKLPVLVWIYGGAMVAGSTSRPTYNGTVFAKGGVIVVSFNYRVGRLGVFAHPALTAENADKGRLANYALMDQIAGLEWVKRNVAAFGGDPGKVTIFGQSAGGLSVNALMVAPGARGLFHGAIAQSGYGRPYFPRLSTATPSGRQSAEDDGMAIAMKLNIPGKDAAALTALRAVPPEKVLEAARGEFLLYYVVDGKVLPHDIWDGFRSKQEAPVPFMLGSTTHEESTVGWNERRRDIMALTKDADRKVLAEAYGGNEMVDIYMQTDFVFTSQVRTLARAHAANGYPTYAYVFSTVPAAANAAEQLGARHGAELRYVFGTMDTGPVPLTTPEDMEVSRVMNATWRAFAGTGSPNAPGLTPWPDFKSGEIMDFALRGPHVHVDDRNGRLDALTEVLDPKPQP